MNPERHQVTRRIILGADAVLVVASMGMAWSLHQSLRAQLGIFKEPPQFGQYATVAYLILPLWLGLVATFRLHRLFEQSWTRFELFIELLKLHAIGFLAVSALLFLTQQTINRAIVFTFIFCSFGLMYLERVLLARWARFQHESGGAEDRFLIVGAPSPDLERWLVESRSSDFPPHLVGILGPGPVQETAEGPGLPCRGTPEDLGKVLHDEAVDKVLFFPPYNHPESATASVRACEAAGVQAAFAVDTVYRYLVAPQVVSLHQRPFLTFDAITRRPEALAVKHGFDFTAALVVILMISPVLIVISLLILATAGWPVLFSQQRVGLHGRRFRMLKFRTMVRDAEARRAELLSRNEMDGPVFKVTDDPRVTRLGQILRRWSLDELPQLFNVLAGSMSLVGPRPLPVSEQQGIEGWHRRRLSMKPGITGLWQVSGRSDVNFDEWMRLDLAYVEQWSLRLDLALLLRTLPAVMLRRGAR